MKSSKILVILILVFALVAGMTACGNNKTSSSGQQADTQQQSEAVQSSIQAETDQVAVASEVIPTVDSKASADSLIGSWKDINSPDRIVNITKTDTGYEYADNEGKYPAIFKDGVLKVKVSDSDSDTADIYVDAKTGHMLSVYQGNTSEYSKK
jgi:hypothetical protein